MISSARFTEDGNIDVVIDGQNMFVPNDIANRHRKLIAQWETDGGVIAPFVTAIVPITVSALSAKLVLDDDGFYGAVKQVCTEHEVPAVRIFWDSALTWSEDHPCIQAIAAELNLSDAAVHNMFERAALK